MTHAIPKAIIFDLDGTLLDTLEDLADSMNSALRSLAFPAHPLASYRQMVGDGAQMLASRAIPQGHQPDAVTVQTAYEHYLEAYNRQWWVKSHPYAGIPAVLDLCVAKGIKLAVYSNKADRFAVRVIDKLLPSWPWAVVRGQRPDTPRKPAADGAIQVLAAMSISPGDAWFVGDSGVDITCGKGAGMLTVGCLWGFRSRTELEEAGADVLATDPEDLHRLITDTSTR